MPTRMPNLTLIVTASIFLLGVSNIHAQILDQDPGHRRFLVLGAVRFSCPKGFDCSRSQTDDTSSFIRHDKYDLELVVSLVSKANVTKQAEQLIGIGASHLFPKENSEYRFKPLSTDDPVSVKGGSKFEITSGALQGFNGKRRVVFQFRVLKVKDKEILVGYLFGLGMGKDAKDLFDRNLGGDSMPGWYAQAHIMASLTGEKYSDINPGTVFISVPVERRPNDQL